MRSPLANAYTESVAGWLAIVGIGLVWLIVIGCTGAEDAARPTIGAAGQSPVVIQNETPIAVGKNDLAALAATAAAQTLAAAGKPQTTPAPAALKPQAVQIGIVRPVWEPIRLQEQALAAQVRQVNTGDPEEYVRAIDQLIRGGANVVITIGTDLVQATQDAAERNPQVRFIGIDQYQERVMPNVVGLVFDDDQAGFLAGALAALMTKTSFVGAIVGPGWMSNMVAYGEGFALGAEYVNPSVVSLVEYHPGELPEGFADQRWGRDTANQMIADGADIIFAAGGATGQAAIDAARARSVLAIGAEVDQYDALPNARGVLLTSLYKVITTDSIKALVKGISEGTIKGGNVSGETRVAPYREAEPKIPAQVRDRVSTIERGLKQGSIKTGLQLH
ncbi:MAG: BMP family ABC transporter substrate-binding protein [Chloroflexi bacterium]|nr:BMP family ABC transporter substrate-binding protein [Chloroflexota bacterium]